MRQTKSMKNALPAIVSEVESHVSVAGWDQPVRLFALVSTDELLAANPHLELSGDLPLTSVEQELDDPNLPLDDMLATIEWPIDVAGAIVVIERIIVPPEVELPEDDSVLEFIAAHPDKHEVRMVSAVLRTGESMNALRLKSHDDAQSVAVAADLVPQLNEALLATFA